MRAALCAAFLVSNIVFSIPSDAKPYAEYFDGQAPSYLSGIPMWCDSVDTLSTERV